MSVLANVNWKFFIILSILVLALTIIALIAFNVVDFNALLGSFHGLDIAGDCGTASCSTMG